MPPKASVFSQSSTSCPRCAAVCAAFNPPGPPPAISNTLAKLAQDAGAELRLNTEVTPELVETLQPDALIVAVGSLPVQPPIPGLQNDNVILVNNYYRQKEQVGDTVIVLGGGLAGCETAIHLAREGKQVALIEMRSELAPDANIRHRPLLLKEIAAQKIQAKAAWYP